MMSAWCEVDYWYNLDVEINIVMGIRFTLSRQESRPEFSLFEGYLIRYRRINV